MTIQIHAPGDVIVEFPDGTPTETISSVMARQFGGQKPAQAPAPNMASGIARSASESIPLLGGLLNKADAATNAALAPALNRFFPEKDQLKGDTFSERYSNSLREQEGLDEGFAHDHPWVDTAAGIAGAVGGMGVAGGTALGARALGLAGKTLPQMITGGAVGGAALGGIDAAIRGGNPAAGALWGGAAGAAGPIVGRVGGAIADKVGRTARAIVTPEAEATAQIREALAKDAGKGLSREEWDAASDRGQPVALMDMGSRATQRLARRAANVSPEAQDTLEATLGSRYRTQNDRTADWLDTTFHYPNADELQSAIDRVERTTNRAAYARAYAAGGKGVWNETLDQMTQAPVVQEALRMAMAGAKDDAALRGFTPPKNPFRLDASGRLTLGQGQNGERLVPSLQFWDHVKRSLDAIGTREAQQWSRILRNHLDPQFPEYAAARGGAAKFFDAENALEAGQKAAEDPRLSNRQMRAGLDKMTDVERRLFQDGFVDRTAQLVRSAPDRRNILDMIAASPNARERIAMAIGPQRAKEMEAFLRVEDLMQRANRKITSGSTTAEQRSDMEVGALDLLRPKKLLEKALLGAAKVAGRGIDERVATKIADMLTSGDKAAFDRAIKLIAKDKRLMGAIRNPDEAYGGIATRGVVSGMGAGHPDHRRGNVTVTD